MKQLLASLLIAGSSITLVSCGFTPVYATQDGVKGSSITVAEIEGQSGHILRNELLTMLRPGLPGIEAGDLEVTLRQETVDFAFRRTGANSRTSVNTVATYKLTTDKGILRGQVTGEASFAAPLTPFADITARRDVQNRSALITARRLMSDLQLKVGQAEAFEPIE